MEDTKLILFYDTCRLCLNKPGFVNMFSTDDIIDSIILCTGVQVSNVDNLPQKICMTCLEIVTNAKRLRILANTNDKHLRSFFNYPLEEITVEEPSYHNLTTVLPDVIDGNVSTNIRANHSETSFEPVESTKSQSSNDTSDYTLNSTSKSISVRKDLFDSTATVTSSTTEMSPLKCEKKYKRRKSDDQDTEYKCETCKKTFQTFKKLYLHRRNHDKKHACSLDGCGKSFATKGDLEKHVRTHTGNRPYECNICHKSFVQRSTLRVHRETVHAELMSETILAD